MKQIPFTAYLMVDVEDDGMIITDEVLDLWVKVIQARLDHDVNDETYHPLTVSGTVEFDRDYYLDMLSD